MAAGRNPLAIVSAAKQSGREASDSIQERQMVAIRLRRAGSKKRPFFRVVVTDSRAARDSSFVEILGHYNPRTKPALVNVEQRARQLLDQQGRAAVRFGADADCAAPDAGGPGSGGRRGGGRSEVSAVRDVVEVLARALTDTPGRGAGRSSRSTAARRSSSCMSRPASSGGSSASRAGRRRRSGRWPRRPARRKARPSRWKFATAGRELGRDGGGRAHRPGARHPRPGHRQPRNRFS